MSRNKAYWKRRSKQVQDEIMNRVYDTYVAMVEDAYTDAIHVMDEKIRVWVQRIAKNNEISYSDAQKLLSKDELEEFHWSVQHYIKRGMDNADGKWAKELENASARVHISRYDAMKFELQALAKETTGKTIGAVKDATALAYTESYHHTAFNLMQQIGVGITMQGVDSRKLEHILNRPWLDDGKTFTARCWEGCDDLVGRINRELFRMIATGEKPDRAIDAIAKAFGTSKANAGRVIMTESAFVASQAQHDCFTELGVEQFEVIGTFDGRMCEFCGEINGKVFPESKRKIGENAPPFHPWCRCCTAPYFEDMKDVGERWMRDPDTGKGGTVPADMTFQEWKAIYVNKSVDYDDWKAKQSEIVPAARNFRIDEINREKVFFDENANYDITIPSYSDAVNRSLSNACKEVAKRGSESGVEFLNIVDLTTGDLLAPIEEGLTDAVGFEQYQKFLDGNTKPFAFVHNHITETPMSYENIQSFSTTKNMEVMISVTNNGLKYVVCGNKKTNKYLYSYYSDEIKNLTLNPPNGRITKDDIEKFIVEKAASEFGNIYAERLDGRVHN